jgi:hypothetical protein
MVKRRIKEARFPTVKSLGQFRLHGDPFAQQDTGPRARPLRVHCSPRERDRGRQQRNREDTHCSRIGAGWLSEGLVGRLHHRGRHGPRTDRGPGREATAPATAPTGGLQAADHRRVRLCAAVDDQRGALFEVFSQRYERDSIFVTSNLPFDALWRHVVFGACPLVGGVGLRHPVAITIKQHAGEQARSVSAGAGIALAGVALLCLLLKPFLAAAADSRVWLVTDIGYARRASDLKRHPAGPG